MYPECALCLWECWWTRGESRQKTTFCNTSGIIKRIFHLFLHVPYTCKFTFSRAGRCINITQRFTHLDNVWRQTELSRCLVSCLWTSLRSGRLGIHLSEGNRISVIWGSICSHDLNRMIESDVQWAVRDSICAKCSGYSTCQRDKMLSKFSPLQCCSNVCQLSRTRSMTPWGNFQVQALFRKCIISFFSWNMKAHNKYKRQQGSLLVSNSDTLLKRCTAAAKTNHCLLDNCLYYVVSSEGVPCRNLLKVKVKLKLRAKLMS